MNVRSKKRIASDAAFAASFQPSNAATRIGSRSGSTVMGMGIHNHQGGKVYAVTRAGQVYSTSDGGKSWRTQQLPAEAGDAFCVAGA